MSLNEADKRWIREQLEEAEARIVHLLNDWADLTVSLAQQTVVLAEWLNAVDERALVSEIRQVVAAQKSKKNADPA